MATPTLESIINSVYAETVLTKTASEKVAAVDVGEAKKVADVLTKAASLNYDANAYASVCEIMKIAGTTVNSLLQAVEARAGEVAGLQKVSTIRGLIDEMIDGGLISKSDAMEKAAALMKKSEHELEIVKEAMSLSKNNAMSNLFDSGTGFTDLNKIASSKRGGGMFSNVV